MLTYSAPRPDGSIILGTSRQYTSMPPSLRHSLINTVDDRAPYDEITANALSSFGEIFPSGGWDTELSHKGQSGAHEYAWTGIIGMTPDAVPFIGSVPGKEGQYVAAGYNGHGQYLSHRFQMLAGRMGVQDVKEGGSPRWLYISR